MMRLSKCGEGPLMPPQRWLFLLSLPLLLVGLAAIPASTESRDQAGAAPDASKAVIAQAEESLRRGDVDGASRLLSEWLNRHPHDIAARITLGVVFQSTGDLKRAESAFHTALQDDPRNVEALAALGSLSDQQGRFEESESFLARAARLQPGSPPIHLQWASVLARLHRYPEAAKALAGVPAPEPLAQRIAYQRLKASVDLGTGNARAAARDMEAALKLTPDDRNLQVATGLAETEASDWSQAVAHLAPAFAANHNPSVGLPLLQAELAVHADHESTLKELWSPDLPPDQRVPFLLRLGEVLAHAGLGADAVRAFQQAVEAGPGRADLYFDLALAQFQAGQLGAALESAGKSKSLGDSAALEDLVGDIQEARGNSLDAAHSYQAAVDLAPDQEQYRLALGLELLKHGTFEPALAVFQEAAAEFPNSTRVHLAVGLTYYFLEKYPEAIKALVEASQIDPKSELALDYLGEIQLQQPVTPDPAAVHRICLYGESHPAGGEALAACGALQLRVEHDRGDPAPSASTVERLRRAASLAPANPTARCALGQALEWAGQWQEAGKQTEVCIRLRPDSAEAHYRMANIFRHLGETQRAQEQIKLHDEAQQRLVETNAQRDRTLKKFLYTMTSASSKDSP